MKPIYLIIVAAIIIVAVVFLLNVRKIPEDLAGSGPIITTVIDDGMKLTTNTDPTQVFQKAFWRRPTSDDQILHAERREWSAEDGVQKWQWFIAVRPGPQLLEWLDTNPFSMAISSSANEIEKPPQWFPNSPKDLTIHKNTGGSFVLMLSSDRKNLYATDSGHGFTPPVVRE